MYLVYDIGGTFVKFAIMNDDGDIIEKSKIPTLVGPKGNVPDFIESLGQIYDKYKITYELEGIAISLPGQVDVEKGIVYGGGGIKYTDKAPIASLLSARCDNIYTSIENDGKCAALAEVWKGNARGCKNAVVVVFGSGIGCGVVIDGKIYRGSRLQAGEISYIPDHFNRSDLNRIIPVEDIRNINDEFENIPFIWSSRNSARAISYNAAKAAGMDPEKMTGEKVYELANEGNQAVIEVLEEAYFSIAKYCLNLYMMYDPEVILIGGGISAQPAFMEGIRSYIEKLKKISKVYNDLDIEVCKFENDSNLIGALYHYKQMRGLV